MDCVIQRGRRPRVQQRLDFCLRAGACATPLDDAYLIDRLLDQPGAPPITFLAIERESSARESTKLDKFRAALVGALFSSAFVGPAAIAQQADCPKGNASIPPGANTTDPS